MTAVANKEVAREIYTNLINGRQVDRAAEYVATDMVEHEKFPGLEALDGVAAFRGWMNVMTTAFADFTCEVERLCADEDLVMAHLTIRGTHTGELMGIPATGRTVEISGCDIIRFENGKCVEHWGVTDQLGLLQQLGAVPTPGATSPTAVHRELHRYFNTREMAAITDKMTEGHFVDHARGLTMKSPDDFASWLDEWTTAFPDAQVQDAVYYEAGNRSICVFTGRGTNTGPMGPLAPTGNRLDLRFCEHVVCDDDGRITGSEIYYDMQTLLVQMGHAQAPPS